MRWARASLVLCMIGGCSVEVADGPCEPAPAPTRASSTTMPASPASCVPMANGTLACSCDEYRQAIVAGIAPEEPRQSWKVDVIAEHDMCLIGDVATIPTSSERYDEFLALDLSSIPSSLRPSGIARLDELAQGGWELVRTEDHIELRSEGWIYAVELFEPPVGWADVAYVARFTSRALQGTYYQVTLIVVTSGLQVMNVRDHVAASRRE